MSALPDAAGSPAAEGPADLLVTAPIARQHLPVRRRQHHARPGQHARAQLPDAHPERAYRGPRLHIGVADLSHRRGSSQKTLFCAPRTDPTEEAVPYRTVDRARQGTEGLSRNVGNGAVCRGLLGLARGVAVRLQPAARWLRGCAATPSRTAEILHCGDPGDRPSPRRRPGGRDAPEPGSARPGRHVRTSLHTVVRGRRQFRPVPAGGPMIAARAGRRACERTLVMRDR
jgi:hypothetical protein